MLNAYRSTHPNLHDVCTATLSDLVVRFYNVNGNTKKNGVTVFETTLPCYKTLFLNTFTQKRYCTLAKLYEECSQHSKSPPIK